MRGAPVAITVDGRRIVVEAGISLAAAMMNAGIVAFRRSVGGFGRAPLCGMGICFECRVTVDGVAHQRSCTMECADGMVIETGAAP